jgi:hypothetical protein
VAEPPAPESLFTIPRGSDQSTPPARVSKAPKPPQPPDPIRERGEQIWGEFESSTEEGRIAIFLETLQDAEVMDDSLAYEMLSCLHSDATERGDRSSISERVAALRERLPEAYEQSAHYYLWWCVGDALAENRLEDVASPTRELAARAGHDIDIFNRAAEALAYHGQLSMLVEAWRVAWPGVKSSDKVMPWVAPKFANTGAEYELFNYLEHTESPNPADPVLLDRIKYFVEEPRQDYLAELIADLTGRSGREWRTDDFKLRPHRKKSRDDWDDDYDEKPAQRDPAAINLQRLIHEFVGLMRREEGVPFPRGRLAGEHLYAYFVERHAGRHDPRPSMLEQAMNPNLKLPKPPPPAHPLCPERVTLDVFLSGMLGALNMLVHPSAAVFQAIPAWLRFLESRRLIDADVRRKVGNDLLPLHATLSKYWQSYQDDPILGRQGQAWPADAARGPAEFVAPPHAAERSG